MKHDDIEEGAIRQRQLMAYVKLWNRFCPVGCEVNVRRDDGQMLQTKTRSEAWLAGGHTPVICVEGITGCFALERVTRR